MKIHIAIIAVYAAALALAQADVARAEPAIVLAFKITENESPRPQDRAYLNRVAKPGNQIGRRSISVAGFNADFDGDQRANFSRSHKRLSKKAGPCKTSRGARVATADCNQDGRPDVIVGAGPGAGPRKTRSHNYKGTVTLVR